MKYLHFQRCSQQRHGVEKTSWSHALPGLPRGDASCGFQTTLWHEISSTDFVPVKLRGYGPHQTACCDLTSTVLIKNIDIRHYDYVWEIILSLVTAIECCTVMMSIIYLYLNTQIPNAPEPQVERWVALIASLSLFPSKKSAMIENYDFRRPKAANLS